MSRKITVQPGNIVNAHHPWRLIPKTGKVLEVSSRYAVIDFGANGGGRFTTPLGYIFEVLS